MLHATLQCHLQNSDSNIAADMLSNVYVDNIVSGCQTSHQAVIYYKIARAIMQQAHFDLRTLASNCQELRSLAEADNVEDPNTTVNVLGLQWDTESDTLHFLMKASIPEHRTLITKREVLQQSSKIFDPLGYLSPVMIQAKLLLQQLWQPNVQWDGPLPQPLQEQWVSVTKCHQHTNL